MAEKRKHKRYRADKSTFAVLRSRPADIGPILNKSMAEVAMAVFRSKPVRLGRVIDISKANGFGSEYRHEIPKESIANWRCSVKFGALRQNQATRLEHFLNNHTINST